MLTLIIVAVVLASFGLIAFIGAPYVPTHRSQLRRAFDELRPITESDLVVDLGSGDGLVLRIAAARGARSLGFELNPMLFGISLISGMQHKGLMRTKLANYSTVRLPIDTTLIYAFADSRSIKGIRKILERHVKRTQKDVEFLSYGFKLPGYEPIGETGGMFLYRIKA